jgi:hypothetical protein
MIIAKSFFLNQRNSGFWLGLALYFRPEAPVEVRPDGGDPRGGVWAARHRFLSYRYLLLLFSSQKSGTCTQTFLSSTVLFLVLRSFVPFNFLWVQLWICSAPELRIRIRGGVH